MIPQLTDATWASEPGASMLIRPDSTEVFFLFTGTNHQPRVDSRAFFEQTRLLDRNLVTFRDPHRFSFYQRGISPQVDSFERLLEWQREFIRAHGITRVFCTGASMGAHAAITYGHALQADAVWAFSPQTLVSLEQSPIAESFPSQRRDLTLLLADPNGKTAYHIYYNESCTPDARAAERIAGLPGVRLWPQPGEGHIVVKTLVENGSLSRVFPPPL